ncbi:MAG: UdgX family uracil-DNA binding protein [Planctomycetota bacterium]
MFHVPIGRDFAAFRRAVRTLVALDVEPAGVSFEEASLFGGDPLPSGVESRPLNLPPQFASAVKLVAHHRDEQRWALLYRLIRRVTKGERHVLDLATDDDVSRLARMEKQIRFDRHKTHAFVRFREVNDEMGDGRMVAWYRPDHYTLPLSAPHFVERYRAMRWAILAPDESATWDGEHLTFGPGVPRDQAPTDDQFEDLWQTYYASIFNPARIKMNAMKKEMPQRFWDLLPETRAMPRMLADAPQRVQAMVKATAQPTRSAADFVPVDRSLPVLREAAAGCRGCDLCEAATQTVFGEGPTDAPIVFVGEQPGDKEDLAGRPFVGPAGQLMDELLAEAGVDRKRVYVTNTVKHFKFEQRGRLRLHRTPAAREVNACMPWLRAELDTIKPTLIVALGATAAQAIMGRQFRVTQSRGQVMRCRYAEKFMATIHPSAILRIPNEPRQAQAKRDFIADMRTVGRLSAG